MTRPALERFIELLGDLDRRCVAQSDRPSCREIENQAIGKWLDGFVLVVRLGAFPAGGAGYRGALT